VQLANLQTAFMTLDTALKVTNRRVNALENVVKPKIENTISYIKVGGTGHSAAGQVWVSAVVWV
jgi:vacuolar-type H+-ATPase subunit D/Vma8